MEAKIEEEIVTLVNNRNSDNCQTIADYRLQTLGIQENISPNQREFNFVIPSIQYTEDIPEEPNYESE